MRKRHVRWVAPIVGALVITGAASWAGLATASQEVQVRGGTTLTFTELFCGQTGSSCHTLDVGRRGDSMGDTLTYNLPLKSDGVVVGRSQGQCVTLRSFVSTTTTGMFLCTGVFHLTDGDISTHGRIGAFSDPWPVSVDGGTGSYVGAAGTATQTGRDITVVLEP